jgi:hypothetical protein
VTLKKAKGSDDKARSWFGAVIFCDSVESPIASRFHGAKEKPKRSEDKAWNESFVTLEEGPSGPKTKLGAGVRDLE